MELARGSLRRRLLDVPVHFESPDPAARERFDICYAAFPVVEDADEEPAIRTRLEVDGDQLVATVEGRPEHRHQDLITAFRALNHELLHALMRTRRSAFYLHAGAVAIDGKGVVLPGLSQAGKSTIVLALLQRGARFLSDELMVFEPDQQRLIPFPRAPKIRDVCVPWFPEFHDHFVGDGEGRFLPLAAIGNDTRAEAVPLHAVFLPRWEEGAGVELAPRKKGRLLLSLTEAALNFGTHKERSIDHLAAMTSGTEGWNLRWSDPHQAAERILDLVR